LGYNISNNQAEYQGLIDGLDYINEYGIECCEIYIRGDSLIVINQMEGRFNVNSSNIIPYYNEAKNSLESIYCDSYYFVHVPRNENWERLIHSPTKPSIIDLLTFESNYLEGGAFSFIC
jgi:ribonuclease HI